MELTIATTNLTKSCIEYFNYKLSPNMKVSLEIPDFFFFDPEVVDMISEYM